MQAYPITEIGAIGMTNSESEFHDALDALISEAASKDIDVVGAWDVRDADRPRSGWSVEITRFASERLESEN